MLHLRISALLIALALASVAARGQLPHTKRLILKDGSFQSATEWQVKGERVRFYSSERDDWEELPNSLVDWAATNKYNKELEAGDLPQPELAPTQEDIAEQAAQEARSPQILPGLRLPESGGAYLLDQFKGKPELAELVQSGGDVHRHMGRNILIAALDPIAGTKQSIEIPGAHAPVQSHQPQPAIYMNIAESADDTPGADSVSQQPPPPLTDIKDRFRIVRLQQKKESRLVGNLKVAFYGKVSQQEQWVPAEVTTVNSQWVKIAPINPLARGEYAVVEMLEKGQVNLYVWDFGVNPSAGENPGTWAAILTQPPAAAPTPAIETRPH